MNKMKSKLIMALMLTLSLHGSVQSQTVRGSDTCLPLLTALGRNYNAAHGQHIDVSGGGTGIGIRALIERQTDLAMASRKIKPAEQNALRAQSDRASEMIVAFDALAVIVNRSCGVEHVTMAQLEQIYSGRLTNWKQIGGADMAIEPLSRETTSGTYEFFGQKVLHGAAYPDGIRQLTTTEQMKAYVGSHPGAIGYIGFSYIDGSVRVLGIGCEGSCVFPSKATALNRSYPIVRPLYLYYRASESRQLRNFVAFCISAEGEKTVEQAGFIPYITSQVRRMR